MAARVGLTGGIGSGKSTVAKLFADRGIQVIDADQVARQLTDIGSAGLTSIVNHFGTGVLSGDGSLDRKALASLVFDNNEERKWLEQLLHPLIRQQMDRAAAQCPDAFCILEIPLLVETSRHQDMDWVIVIHCPEPIRTKRLIENRQMTQEQIDKILRQQASDEQRLAIADVVIDNSGEESALAEQVSRVCQQLAVVFPAP